MIPVPLLKSLNEQLNYEFHSSFHYLAMESYFRELNLAGFARLMRNQHKEERLHALKIFDYLNERSCKVHLAQVEEPPSNWDSPLEAIEDAFQQEQRSSGMINDLVDLAVEKRDHATDLFLKWFVQNQVEEEAMVSSLVQKLKLIGNDSYGLYLIDRDMA